MMEMRARTIAGIRKAYDVCRETKAVHDQYVKIGWKGRKEKFLQEHADELNRYEKADRFLRKNVPDGKIDFTSLSREMAKLEKDLIAKNEKLAAVQADLKILKDVRYFVKELLPEIAPDDQTKTQEKRSIHEQLEKNRRAIQENDAKRNPTLRQKGTGRDEI
jgi:hypothetical protein